LKKFARKGEAILLAKADWLKTEKINVVQQPISMQHSNCTNRLATKDQRVIDRINGVKFGKLC
jgi:hypothetical protein